MELINIYQYNQNAWGRELLCMSWYTLELYVYTFIAQNTDGLACIAFSNKFTDCIKVGSSDGTQPRD